jgi:hypothetical protein
VGSTAAGMLFDAFHSYTAFLWFSGCIFVASALTIATLGAFPSLAISSMEHRQPDR